MPHRPEKEWMDISIAIDEIETFVSGKSFSMYCGDKMLQAALERKLEVIGYTEIRNAFINGDVSGIEMCAYCDKMSVIR